MLVVHTKYEGIFLSIALYAATTVPIVRWNQKTMEQLQYLKNVFI